MQFQFVWGGSLRGASKSTWNLFDPFDLAPRFLNMVDPLTPEQRHRAMANVQLKNGPFEIAIGRALHRRGYKFRKHVKYLPGTPDLVFPGVKVAVFIDGDFWHGYRLPLWEHKLSSFWKEKLRTNRKRDQRNFRRLRLMGWRVVRIWQHQIKKDIDSCVEKIIKVTNKRRRKSLVDESESS